MKKSILSLCVFSMAVFYACDSADDNTQTGSCNGQKRYMEMTQSAGGTVQPQDTLLYGGATMVQLNASDADTMFINFGFDNGSAGTYSFQAGIVNPSGTGTYTYSSLTNVILVWNNSFGVCYDFTLNIDELGTQEAHPMLPNTFIYTKVAGTFSGQFAWSSPDTVTYTGSFCGELP